MCVRSRENLKSAAAEKHSSTSKVKAKGKKVSKCGVCTIHYTTDCNGGNASSGRCFGLDWSYIWSRNTYENTLCIGYVCRVPDAVGKTRRPLELVSAGLVRFDIKSESLKHFFALWGVIPLFFTEYFASNLFTSFERTPRSAIGLASKHLRCSTRFSAFSLCKLSASFSTQDLD